MSEENNQNNLNNQNNQKQRKEFKENKENHLSKTSTPKLKQIETSTSTPIGTAEGKRKSRNEETLTNNALVYLIIKMGFDVKVRRTKKTKHTTKMIVIEEITHSQTGTKMYQSEVAYYSKFMLEMLGYEPKDTSTMTLKQQKRSREAELNNAMLYFLTTEGFSITEKKSKMSVCTEHLIRIKSLMYQEKTITKETLIDAGRYISEVVNQLTIKSTFSITRDLLIENFVDVPLCHFQKVFDQLDFVRNEVKNQKRSLSSEDDCLDAQQPTNEKENGSHQSPIVIPEENVQMMYDGKYPQLTMSNGMVVQQYFPYNSIIIPQKCIDEGRFDPSCVYCCLNGVMYQRIQFDYYHYQSNQLQTLENENIDHQDCSNQMNMNLLHHQTMNEMNNLNNINQLHNESNDNNQNNDNNNTTNNNNNE